MKKTELIPSKTNMQLQEIASLADEIWHQHFTPIIGTEQVDYMLKKFQSFPALRQQMKDGYEYFQIHRNQQLCGYFGIHQEASSLFLSKLYIRKDCRGQHLSTEVFHYLTDLCKERGISNIWLTCNKYNEHTLTVYNHLGFTVTSEQVADIGNGYVMDDYILTYTI